ncbi:MAG TPA: diaminopimelate decarboxylase, partial [bacterium]|nr:diaminopimelate decarboxylase [bacterium]
MDHFVYRNNELFCEEVPVADLVAQYGTPLYIYSRRTLLDHYRKLDGALRDLDHLICYSVKTNGNLAVLRALHDAGSGFDIVSGGELFRVQRAGGDPARVVYAGVGKRDDEIAQALAAGICMFNCESFAELEAINRVAAGLNLTARCALRINPDVDAHTHAHITTGIAENKFGILIPEAGEIYARARQLPAVQLCDVHVHLGELAGAGV